MTTIESVVASAHVHLENGGFTISVIRTSNGLADDSPVDVIRIENHGHCGTSSSKMELMGQDVKRETLLKFSDMFKEAADILFP